MFLRRCQRRKDGKVHTYWALVESHRTAKGSRQRVVAYLGELKPSERTGWAELGRHLDRKQRPQPSLFDPPAVEDSADDEPVLVNLKGVRLERLRDFGDAWLALGLWRLVGLDVLLEQLLPQGREDVPWPLVVAILVIARFCEPSSELHIEHTWYRRSALEELLGVPVAKVYTDRLYQGLDLVLPQKAALEKHLKERLGTLFDLRFDLLLYDVTSTYFEGQCRGNPKAQRGYSRDSRPDCRLRDPSVANRRLGRLLQRYQRAAAAFEVKIAVLPPVEAEPGKRKKKAPSLAITWTRGESWHSWAELSEGCYLLRTNLVGVDACTLWKRYIQLTDAEWAFRIHKDELAIRPIWHHKDERVQAHILVCFLAYVLWKTLTQWMQRSGLGDAPRTLLEELAKIKSGDVVLPTQRTDGRPGCAVRLRCVTTPDAAQKVLLNRLGITLPTRLRRLEEPVQM
jgi:hypothetical protein